MGGLLLRRMQIRRGLQDGKQFLINHLLSRGKRRDLDDGQRGKPAEKYGVRYDSISVRRDTSLPRRHLAFSPAYRQIPCIPPCGIVHACRRNSFLCSFSNRLRGRPCLRRSYINACPVRLLFRKCHTVSSSYNPRFADTAERSRPIRTENSTSATLSSHHALCRYSGRKCHIYTAYDASDNPRD